MLRSAILAAARNERLEHVVTNAPVSRSVVRRFVGGADTADAVEATRRLEAHGLTVTLDHLGEDTTDRAHADAVAGAYLELLDALRSTGLTERLGELTAGSTSASSSARSARPSARTARRSRSSTRTRSAPPRAMRVRR